MNEAYEKTVQLWQDFGIDSSVKLCAYLENFATLFAYHSGKIENNEITYHDTHEIFENGKVIGYTGNLRTLYEIQNMKDAYQLMMRWFDEKHPLTLEAIKEMHYQLTKGTYDERRWELDERPGEFKKNDLWGVDLNDIASLVSEVEEDLQNDLTEISDVDDEKVLIAAAFFHARFEGIHAFADGNGRTGRALMNYHLIIHNHPPLIVYEEERKTYYDALDHFDETGDLDPLIDFLRNQTVKTWENTVSRYEKTKSKATQQ